MGHSFGMQHDENETCSTTKCIMNGYAGEFTEWSQTSKRVIANFLRSKDDFCLENLPKYRVLPQSCGNGLIESDEDCDCGLEEVCNNPCCDPKTCKFKKNAHCASGECCDLELCQYKSAGVVCRPSKGECDKAEYCRGTSEFCPAEQFKSNGQECKSGAAYCFEGTCKTHFDECQNLWFEADYNGKEFYKYNMNGDTKGHCGYVNGEYEKCQEEDILCGLLHCHSRNETGHLRVRSNIAEQASNSLHTKTNNQWQTQYFHTVFWKSPDVNHQLGMVPNGAKCGTDKMCRYQKCVSAEWVRNISQSIEEEDQGDSSFLSKYHHLKVSYLRQVNIEHLKLLLRRQSYMDDSQY